MTLYCQPRWHYLIYETVMFSPSVFRQLGLSARLATKRRWYQLWGKSVAASEEFFDRFGTDAELTQCVTVPQSPHWTIIFEDGKAARSVLDLLCEERRRSGSKGKQACAASPLDLMKSHLALATPYLK